MKFMSIASGSSGNSLFVGSEKTNILIDVGISKKKITEGLNSIHCDLKDIDAILITHEHIDHVRGLGVISRSYEIPIYATGATCQQLTYMKKELGDFDYDYISSIKPDEPFMIGDLCINAHGIWHDAVDPVCYTITNGNKKISIATDLGDYDDYIVENLKDCDAMLIEANHDIRMLEAGPYPYQTKKRILSRRGHLSNEAGGRLIKSLLSEKVKHILLGHLSDKNNYPELAYEAVKNELSDNNFSNDVRDFDLQVASRNTCGKLLNV